MFELTLGVFIGALLGCFVWIPFLPIGLLYNWPVGQHFVVGLIVGLEASSSIAKSVNYLNLSGASENPQMSEAIISLLKKGQGLKVVYTLGQNYLVMKLAGLFVCFVLVIVNQADAIRLSMQLISMLGVILAGLMWLVISRGRPMGLLVLAAGILISLSVSKLNSQYTMLALSTALFSVGGVVSRIGEVDKLPKQIEGEAIEAGDPQFFWVGLISSLFIGIPTGVLVEAFATVLPKEGRHFRDDLDWAGSNAFADGFGHAVVLFMGLQFGSTRAAATTGFQNYSLFSNEIGVLLVLSAIVSIAVYYYVLPLLVGMYRAFFGGGVRFISLIQMGIGAAIVVISMGVAGPVLLAIGCIYQLVIRHMGVKAELALVPMSIVPLLSFVS